METKLVQIKEINKQARIISSCYAAYEKCRDNAGERVFMTNAADDLLAAFDKYWNMVTRFLGWIPNSLKEDHEEAERSVKAYRAAQMFLFNDSVEVQEYAKIAVERHLNTVLLLTYLFLKAVDGEEKSHD